MTLLRRLLMMMNNHPKRRKMMPAECSGSSSCHCLDLLPQHVMLQFATVVGLQVRWTWLLMLRELWEKLCLTGKSVSLVGGVLREKIVNLRVEVRLKHDTVLGHVSLTHAQSLTQSSLTHSPLSQRSLTVSLTHVLTQLTVSSRTSTSATAKVCWLLHWRLRVVELEF